MGNQASKVIAQKKKQEKNEKPEPSSRRSSITEFFSKRKQSITSLMKKEQDMKEHDLQQREHYLLKLARKGNTWTNLDSPKVIVESGIGNGIWALEMATQYSESQVIGLDLKLPDIQLANQTFHRANILETWPIDDDSADFVFQRNMCICIQQDQWIHVLKEMFRVIKRGGCVELIEPELLHHQPGPVLQAFHAFYKEQCTQANIDLELKSMNDWLSEVGFEAIECKVLDLPIGEWQTETELKQYGFMNKEIQKTYLKNKKSEYTIKWGMSSIDYDVAVNEVCNEVEQYKSFTRFNCWMAKKPL